MPLTPQQVDEAFARIMAMAVIIKAKQPRFLAVYCSACGQCFGPGESGFSHCKDHQHLTARDA
jgi:hypothetical protein